jgi:glycosyltransferase involved in cell wall biosynthesis
MRIGVNALYLIPGGVGGTEIYLRNLLAALAAADHENEYVVFTNRETGPDLVPAAANFRVAQQPVKAKNRPWRILWEQTGLVAAARREWTDVMFNPGFTCPLVGGPPNVTVFHDLQHLRHPENFRWFDLPFWRLLLAGAARRSRALIAVSEATRDDLRRYYGREATVVHHGVERAFFEIAGERSPERFLLCVSTLHPHKNLERLIRAFDVPDMRLVITGLRGFHTQAIERLIAARGLDGRITLTGWIPRQELYRLYRRAWAFVYPSTFEGFGMPVLEAMAAGLPVACSSIPTLREIAGETVRYFDPESEADIAVALRALAAGQPRGTEAAQARAAEFTWERAARETLGCWYAALR